MCGCVQYVSALRPPKPSGHAVNGGKAVNNKNEEDDWPMEGRRRVWSLTYQKPAPAHNYHLPRRSLHNPPLGSQSNCSLEEELKRRRRLAGFDQCYAETNKSDSDSDSDSAEGTETNENEWKQVRDGRVVGSQLLLKETYNEKSFSCL